MKWDAFIRHILPAVPGCPDFLAIDHTIRAAREFCTRTGAWSFAARDIPSVKDVRLYTLQLAEGQELVRVLRLTVAGTEYDIPAGFIGRARQGGYTATLVGGQDFVLDPAPHIDGQPIVTDIAVRPTLDAPEWPDDLGEYLEDIVAGAIGSLCLLPGKDWTNADVAAVNRARFTDRMGSVAIAQTLGRGRSRRNAKGAWF